MPLVWQCRSLWYQVRCGKPGIALHVDGLPDFALVPIAAAGDAQGNLREMECEMIALNTSDGEVSDGIGRLYVVACETSKGRAWFVSVEPGKGIPHYIVEACQRFANFFSAALQMDHTLH